MARYQKVFPMVDSQASTFGQIQQLLTAKGFRYEIRNGEQVFHKGDGVWAAERVIKVLYFGNYVQLEAWIDSMGSEMGIDGVYGWAVKGPLRKLVAAIEEILVRPNAGFVPQQEPVSKETAQPAFCAKCGTALVSGGVFCPTCGHPAGAPAAPVAQVQLPADISKRTYFKEYAGDSFKKNLRVAGILGYVCAGLNAVISVLFAPLGLIDSIIFLGLTLGMHLGKSKICAIGMVVYAAFTVLLGLILNGTLSGWLWIVASVSALMVFINAEKRYKELTGKR